MKKSPQMLCLFLFFMSLFSFATPPPGDVVFQLSAQKQDPNTFLLNWNIKKGFFLYQKSIQMTLPSDANFHLGELRYPNASPKKDAQEHTYFIYREHLDLPVSILGTEGGEGIITVHYQGCADDGFCYPPTTKDVKVTLNSQRELTDIHVEKTQPSSMEETSPTTQNDLFNQLFLQNDIWLILISFYGFGLLLSFTPCVLPMVPVLSGIIVGHSHTLSTRKAFFLSLCYVLGMSVTYAFVGALVALVGNNLQIAMQSPWTITLFSLLFVLLALSMFQVYELRLPTSWQARLAKVTRSEHGGHYLGCALMGALSTLILSPCVTAPLIGALTYIAKSGDVMLGTLSLFCLSLGMGTPLLLIGTSAAKLLPKTGYWMNYVKSFFGVLLLAVAIYLMTRILPSFLIMLLWAALCLFSGLFIGAFEQTSSHQDKWRQGFGILLVAYALLILVGASLGNNNPLTPLLPSKAFTTPLPQEINTVKTLKDVQQAIRHAKGKPILLDFYADWCASCKAMEHTMDNDHKVQQALSHVVVLKVDVTANNTETQTLLNHFNVIAPPTFLFLTTTGEERPSLRLVGDTSMDVFYDHLIKINDI